MRLLRPRVTKAWLPGFAVLALLLVTVWTPACGGSVEPSQTSAPGTVSLEVLVAETFLADIVRNVAGSAASVEALMPLGADPHAFELTPAGAVKVAKCDVLVVNGAGFEPTLDQMLENIGENAEVIEASAGLVSRTAREGEEVEQAGADEHHHDEGDPHFWLDPTLVVTYVENIRDGLSKADPANAATYAANAAAYSRSLEELDTWITQQVSAISPDRRLLVTNHESLGYFADRYGFKVVGTVMPSVGTGASPSPQQLARLIDTIRQTGIRAIFLETGSNPDLAEQVADETGITVVTQLYTHSLTEAGGAAPTYLEMMRADTEAIVAALK
jgi:ABC-type Zn uptake system ZnuABC Zn-binding protein ZnuA